MKKRWITIILAAVLGSLLTGCSATEKQKVTTGVEADKVFDRLYEKEKMTSYDSVESVILDEKVELGDGITLHYQYAFYVKGITDEYPRGKKDNRDRIYIVQAIDNDSSGKAVQVDTEIAVPDKRKNMGLVASSFEIDPCEGKMFLTCSSKNKPPYEAKALKIPMSEIPSDEILFPELKLDVSYALGSSKKELTGQYLSDGGYRDPGEEEVTLKLPEDWFE